MPEIGRRIVVYGPASTGKTTVASRIASSIGAPHVELDAVFWLPDWTPKPEEEFRADVSALLEKYPGGWVFDGNYRLVRDLILPLADTVVWLHPPFLVACWWLWKRTISRAWRRDILWGTNYESFRQSFFSRDSLILYQMTHWRRSLKRTASALTEIHNNAAVFELRSAREVNEFLASLASATYTS
jgi:adenylate kinase family enzyme